MNHSNTIGSNFAIKDVLISFLSCAVLSASELDAIGLSAFKVYRSIIPDALGLLPKYFALTPIAVYATLSTFGWCDGNGQSLVLYSRLNLTVRHRILLCFILCMIIMDATILSVPQIIVTYCSILSRDPVFPCVFNIIVSTLSIVAALRLLRLYPIRSKRRVTPIYQLLGINVIIIVMDISLLVLKYLDYFIIQSSLRTFLYTMKLKLEVAVLSRLVSLVQYNPQDSLQLESGHASVKHSKDTSFSL
ncbi:hypothetical protein BDV29DRAFT_198668 [Aspergillus leporis]|uniref:DUF7703 domain-containing protein n=1 Tax=Aspergillus leporis TaxID=41062 RepID=A0A5N5WP71_9EURO|nr:hypothetical protein BDV29DRAFT_198668 [Aspergillus leporis]